MLIQLRQNLYIKRLTLKPGILIIIITLAWNLHIRAQNPLRFKEEADSLSRLQIENFTVNKVILFTGSSTIRMWNNVQEYFPDKITINTGFGGSHWSDLLFYLDGIVLKYSPDKIFIYEGDNDLAGGKKSGKIMRDAKKVVRKIDRTLPGTQVVLISAKPSLARWALKPEYEKLNYMYKKYASRRPNVDYVDVWSLMLDSNGEPIKEIFIEDGLHMNKAGYDIWAEEIGKFLK